MRVYLFFKIALVFLALDSCGGCEPEDLLDIECQNQKADDIWRAEDIAAYDRSVARDSENMSEEEIDELIAEINSDLEDQKQQIRNRPCD